jgi:soluble lytic murein transglycosylase-like protein
MESRPARRSSLALLLLLTSSFAATPYSFDSAEARGDEPGSPQGARAETAPPAEPSPAAQPNRGATFLRAHVANRMQRFRDQDSEEVAEAILAASRLAEIDPLLLLAIIEVESAFDPTARSDRNALGLMQVRPATLWREVERSGLEGDDPHDPELNVAAGALYFRRLVRAFGPNDVALMAYNAGPNRILGLIRAGQIPDHFLEYPRRVRAVEARLRRALAVDSAGTAVARIGVGPEALAQRAPPIHSDRVRDPGASSGGEDGR